MSYGKEFKIDGQVYLLEIFEKHVYIAKKNGEDDYSSIFEGDNASFFWDDELIQLGKLDYEDSLYAMLIKCLNWKGITNSKALYQKFLYGLLEDKYYKEDILASSSDELLVYLMYFPLDYKGKKFKTVSTSLIDGFKNAL